MGYLKSQNGDIVILMHKIVAVRVVKYVRSAFNGGNQCLDKNYSYDINVIGDGCELNMASYTDENSAITVMNEIISRISKDKSYHIPVKVGYDNYEV